MRRLGILLLVLMVLYFIFLIRQDIIDNLRLKREEQAAIKSIQREGELAREYQQKLKDLESERYIEKLARTRLGLIKKGETAYKVVDENH